MSTLPSLLDNPVILFRPINLGPSVYLQNESIVRTRHGPSQWIHQKAVVNPGLILWSAVSFNAFYPWRGYICVANLLYSVIRLRINYLELLCVH